MMKLKQFLLLPVFLGTIGVTYANEGLIVSGIELPEEGQEMRIGMNELVKFEITNNRDDDITDEELNIGIIANGHTDTATISLADTLETEASVEPEGFLPVSVDVPAGTGEYCLFTIDDEHGSDTLCVPDIEFVNVEFDIALTDMMPEDGVELVRGESAPFNVTISNQSDNDLNGPFSLPITLFFLDLDDYDPGDPLTEEEIISAQQTSFSRDEGEIFEGGESYVNEFGELTVPEEAPETMAILVRLSMSEVVDPEPDNNSIVHVYSTLATSLADIDNFDNQLTIYPNPANSYQDITIEAELENAADVSLEVYDLNGKQVYSKDAVEFVPGKNEITIEGDTLDSGLYIYRLNDGENHIDGKIVVE